MRSAIDTQTFSVMATRQLRLTTLQEIREKLGAHTGKKINIVLRDRTVFYGKLKEIQATHLEFVNLRNRSEKLPLDTISEVYLDSNQ